jgi:hypothetical protein
LVKHRGNFTLYLTARSVAQHNITASAHCGGNKTLSALPRVWKVSKCDDPAFCERDLVLVRANPMQTVHTHSKSLVILPSVLEEPAALYLQEEESETPISTRLHGVTAQKSAITTVGDMRTSSLTETEKPSRLEDHHTA